MIGLRLKKKLSNCHNVKLIVPVQVQARADIFLTWIAHCRKKQKIISRTGDRTRVSTVTARDTNHYTIRDLIWESTRLVKKFVQAQCTHKIAINSITRKDNEAKPLENKLANKRAMLLLVLLSFEADMLENNIISIKTTIYIYVYYHYYIVIIHHTIHDMLYALRYMLFIWIRMTLRVKKFTWLVNVR